MFMVVIFGQGIQKEEKAILFTLYIIVLLDLFYNEHFIN